jgi:FkbM family methyltransferase
VYKPDKYDKQDVIISVGCFSRESLAEWQAHAPCLVVDYEPTPELYGPKKDLEANNGIALGRLECHSEAVSDFNGKTVLYYYRGGPIGNSITMAWRGHVELHEYFERKMEVQVVSMESVLQRFARVKELWLNCEGAEILILMNTPAHLFARCDYISVEFHRFSSFLNITNGQILACVERLKEHFRPVLGEDYHPYWEFFRK